MNSITRDGLWGFLGLFGLIGIYAGFKDQSLSNVLFSLGLVILSYYKIYRGSRRTFTKSLGWNALFWISVFMTFMSYGYGDSRLLMDIFRVIFPILIIWSWKKQSDIQSENGPTEHVFTLGNIEIFNDVLEQYTTSDQKISVKCLEPYRKVFDFKTYPSKYINHKILVGDREYSLHDISKFIIDEDENIKKFYAAQASIKRATGKGGQSIADAMARQRDLRETRRVIIEFKDDSSYLLSNVVDYIAKDIEAALSV